MVVSQTGHHSVNVQRPVVVVLNFVPGIVAIQVHSLVASLVTILALTKSRGNVTHSSVPVRKQTNKQTIYIDTSIIAIKDTGNFLCLMKSIKNFLNI